MADPLDTSPNEPPAGTGRGARHAVEPPLPRAGRTPSPRVAAAMAATMLAIGVAVGAAIGPAPSSSLADASRLPLLLPSLIAASAPASAPAPASATPPPALAPSVRVRLRRSRAATAVTPPATSTPAAVSPPSAEEAAPSTPASGTQQPTLPPVTNVWLVELAGSSFSGALAQPSAAPYIDGQAVAAGTLLSGWSALDASAFASDAVLLASKPPQLLDTIVEPPCPEGAAGAHCATGTPGALTAADSFLSQTIATLTANPAYRASGLIVVTFGSVLSATATGLPAGASTATLTSQPPAGALLISPFAKAAARPTTAFNPASPRQSVEALLHR
ncbi:MAG TPA: hypothetical protein VNZ01_12785 [Solirubrobacteraceae bacterium]|jgi:hypothetical protein|nr:hypothetical protein [Solirubrobacteraceae bacterium]